MNVQVATKRLADALNHVERIVPTRNATPGTNLLRVDLTPESLVLSGTNLDLDVEATLPADVRGDGTFALPAHVFAQVVRAVPGDEVTLEATDGELSVTSGDFATRLQLVDPDNAPRPTFPDTYPGTLPAKAFATALGRVRYAAAVAEYQAIFRGVKLELNDGSVRAIATDGFRLAYADVPEAAGLQGEPIIPARSVDELTKVLNDGDVDIAVDDTQFAIRTDTVRMSAKLMEGTFPDYRRVIPDAFPVTLMLEASALRDAVNRVAVMADKTANNRVDLFVKDGTLQITSEGAYGRAQEAVPVEQTGSDPEMALAYNAKYLTDALAPLDGALRLDLSGATSPSVLSDPGDATYLAMVVPLRTG